MFLVANLTVSDKGNECIVFYKIKDNFLDPVLSIWHGAPEFIAFKTLIIGEPK